MKQRFTLLILLLITIVGFANAQPSKKGTPVKVYSEITYAKPTSTPLTMDIYVPQTGKRSYPVLVIYHGGGWLINTNKIMSSMSDYVASNGEYVVCNVNYRLLGDSNNTTTINQIIEDVFGALAWIKENIAQYGGDPTLVAVTGDSAGGHLTSSVVLMGDKLESDGFKGETLGFTPSYIPKGETAESLAQKGYLKVQAAIISYGAFDMYAACQGGFETSSNVFWSFAKVQPRGLFGSGIDVNNNGSYYKAVSPIYNIPNAKQKQLPPQLFTVGSKDNLTTPSSIKSYIAKLKEAGHTDIEYWEYDGRPHAFLDSGSNQFLGTSFEKDAPAALDKIIDFLNKKLKK